MTGSTEKSHGLLFLFVPIIFIGTASSSLIDSYLEGESYLATLVFSGLAILIISYGVSYKLKPWKKESILALDYWYYATIAVGVILFAAYDQEERRSYELDLFSVPLEEYEEYEYSGLKSICSDPSYRIKELCGHFEVYFDQYNSSDLSELKDLVGVWKMHSYGIYFGTHIKIYLGEQEDSRKTLNGFTDDIELLYMRVRNKVFRTTKSKVTSRGLSQKVLLVFWPFILMFAFSIKFSKTLISHKNWAE